LDEQPDPHRERSSLLFDLREAAELLTLEEVDLDLLWLDQG
jgi:hypothetical protein